STTPSLYRMRLRRRRLPSADTGTSAPRGPVTVILQQDTVDRVGRIGDARPCAARDAGRISCREPCEGNSARTPDRTGATATGKGRSAAYPLAQEPHRNGAVQDSTRSASRSASSGYCPYISVMTRRNAAVSCLLSEPILSPSRTLLTVRIWSTAIS